MLRGTAGLASSTKDLGRQQHRLLSLHFSTALCVISTWKLDRSICKNPTLWFSIRHPPTWPRKYLLLVQRPGRQPFSKRHKHRPELPAPHIFSFLVLSIAAIRNEFSISSARGSMQAITSLSLLLLYRNLAAHTLTLLFTYIIYCHVSWKPNFLHHLRSRRFTLPREHITDFFASESVPLQRKLQTRPILALDACQRR